jgi:hypothetical protein
MAFLLPAMVNISAFLRQERVMSAIKRSSVFAAVFLGMFVSSARAQGTITVKVPFPFVVNHEEFPAGQYDIRTVGSVGTVISIEGMNNRSFAFALTVPTVGRDPEGDQPVLVFKRYENGYRLSQIWESSAEGRELPGPSAAPETARVETQTEPSEGQAQVVEATWK